MKFEFKGLSSYEEDAKTSYVGASKIDSVVEEFDDIESAIAFVDAHHGFMVTNGGQLAFVVRNIRQVK